MGGDVKKMSEQIKCLMTSIPSATVMTGSRIKRPVIGQIKDRMPTKSVVLSSFSFNLRGLLGSISLGYYSDPDDAIYAI